ncbi:MAG: glycosyltransferase [Methylococcaceae bacterium]
MTTLVSPVDISDKITDAYYGKMGELFMRETQQRIHWICNYIQGKNILDVGCSQGILPILLAREGFFVTGLDANPKSIEDAIAYLANEPLHVQQKINFINDDFLSYKQQTFQADTLVMSEVLEHLLQPQRFIEAAALSLVEQGRLIITIPFGINDFIDHKHTFYLLEPYQLIARYFDIVAIKILGKWLGLVATRRAHPIETLDEYYLSNTQIAELETAFFQIERRLRDDLSTTQKEVREVKQKYQTVSGDLAALKQQQLKLEAAQLANLRMQEQQHYKNLVVVEKHSLQVETELKIKDLQLQNTTQHLQQLGDELSVLRERLLLEQANKLQAEQDAKQQNAELTQGQALLVQTQTQLQQAQLQQALIEQQLHQSQEALTQLKTEFSNTQQQLKQQQAEQLQVEQYAKQQSAELTQSQASLVQTQTQLQQEQLAKSLIEQQFYQSQETIIQLQAEFIDSQQQLKQQQADKLQIEQQVDYVNTELAQVNEALQQAYSQLEQHQQISSELTALKQQYQQNLDELHATQQRLQNVEASLNNQHNATTQRLNQTEKKLEQAMRDVARADERSARVKGTLSYRLGNEIVMRSDSVIGLLTLPSALLNTYKSFKRERGTGQTHKLINVATKTTTLPASKKRYASIQALEYPQANFARLFHAEHIDKQQEHQAWLNLEQPKTLSLPVANSGEIIVMLQLEGVSAETLRDNASLVSLEFLNAQNSVCELNDIVLPHSKTVGSYLYLADAPQRQTIALHCPVPTNASQLRLNFQKWTATSPRYLNNKIDYLNLKYGISVIVPSYKGEKTIIRCLESLYKQSLDKNLYEVIIVINGEPDNSVQLINEYITKHKKLVIKLLILKEAGASLARNTAASHINYNYSVLVDDDDWISENYLQALLKATATCDIPVAFIHDVHDSGFVDTHNSINKQIENASNQGKNEYHDLSMVLTINACKLFPSRIWLQVAFNESLKSGEDVVFWSDIIAKFKPRCMPLAVKTGAVYFRYLKQNSVSRQSMSFDFHVLQRLDVIEGLNTIITQTEDETIKKFITSKINAQSRFISQFLTEEPSQRHTVIDTIQQRKIYSFPFELLNKNQASTLVIAYCFPPYVDTSGIVVAKRLREAADIVDVVYNDMCSVRKSDKSLNYLIADLIDTRLLIKSPSSFGNWRGIESFTQQGFERILQLQQRKESSYKTIYSRVLWPASNFLAYLCKQDMPQAQWQAEFSDPVLIDIHGKERQGELEHTWLSNHGVIEALQQQNLPIPSNNNLFFWCEYLAYCFADQLIFTNKNQLEYMLLVFPIKEIEALIRQKAVIKPQPTLPDSYYHLSNTSQVVNPETINLAYFGSFYETRGISDIFAAIATLNTEAQQKIKLYIFTNQLDEVQQASITYHIEACIEARPYVGYLEFLAVTKQFDCLIVNDAETLGTKEFNPYLPSKYSDYLGSGMPIWILYEQGSILSQMDVYAYRSEIANIEAITQVLKDIKKVIS